MTSLEIVAFFSATALAGAINSVAGGGTFLTFPLFTFFGLSALQANVMSTIALWPGSLASVFGYKNALHMERKTLMQFYIICIIGGILGSLTLLHTKEITFARYVPWLMLSATIIFTFGRQGIALLHKKFPRTHSTPLIAMLFQLIVAFYGGYFGAGIGILTLAMLQILGMSDIHQMNALKVRLAAAINAATVVIFVSAGAVMWGYAAVMVSGGIFGGYVGAKYANKIPAKHLRAFISATGFAMTAYYFVHGA